MAFVSEEDKNNLNKDIDVMLKNGQAVSDAITDVYADFNREFTQKFAPKVNTGECIIQKEEFVKMFSDYNLRKYRNNSEMVEVDTIIIVVVNKMNYVLREILEGTYKEKYVLFAVVCSEYPNQLLISKDNRWVTGEDYIQKRNELLEMLKVR